LRFNLSIRKILEINGSMLEDYKSYLLLLSKLNGNLPSVFLTKNCKLRLASYGAYHQKESLLIGDQIHYGWLATYIKIIRFAN
jgi:hypothetical protein